MRHLPIHLLNYNAEKSLDKGVDITRIITGYTSFAMPAPNHHILQST
jgi:hypothetical protein